MSAEISLYASLKKELIANLRQIKCKGNNEHNTHCDSFKFVPVHGRHHFTKCCYYHFYKDDPKQAFYSCIYNHILLNKNTFCDMIYNKFIYLCVIKIIKHYDIYDYTLNVNFDYVYDVKSDFILTFCALDLHKEYPLETYNIAKIYIRDSKKTLQLSSETNLYLIIVIKICLHAYKYNYINFRNLTKKFVVIKKILNKLYKNYNNKPKVKYTSELFFKYVKLYSESCSGLYNDDTVCTNNFQRYIFRNSLGAIIDKILNSLDKPVKYRHKYAKYISKTYVVLNNKNKIYDAIKKILKYTLLEKDLSAGGKLYNNCKKNFENAIEGATNCLS